jgi:hypothetical protein
MTDLEYKQHLEKQIRKLNFDYVSAINSPQFILGYSIERFLKRPTPYFFRKVVKSIIELFSKRRKSQLVYKVQSEEYKKFYKKVAVYTVITGNYDDLDDPVIVPDNYDFYVFTDQELTCKIWKRLPLPNTKYDNVRLSRYIKMHSLVLFPEYEYSVYIDANIRIIGDLNEYVSLIESKSLMVVKHPFRDSVEEECKECIALKKDSKKLMKTQVNKYLANGFPLEFGLFEGGFQVRKHNVLCKSILEFWWNEYMNGSNRDQLCLPYAIWKHDPNLDQVVVLCINFRLDSIFRYSFHRT